MPLGQGWVNAWVKVNSKNSVLPNSRERDSEREDVLNKSNNKSQRASRASSSVTTARTAISEDAETQAFNRFNHRKHKRRLNRAVSPPDLVRDKAKGKGDKKGSDEAEATLDKSSSTQGSSNNKEVPRLTQMDKQKNQARTKLPLHEDPSVHSVETEGSLRFVAGFFGADIESLEAGAMQQSAQREFKQEHDAASVQVIGQHSHLDAASIVSRAGQSLPGRPFPLPKSDSNDNASKVGGMGILFPQNFFAGDNNSKGGCRQCNKLETDLSTFQEELEYLREMALRSEYVCTSCKMEPSKRPDPSFQSPDASGTSQILNEMTQRHNSQIEQIVQERAHWQQEMQVKVQKYATLCKDLNEEAALRNEEALTLHRELDAVRAERDKMATELEKASAIIAQYEKNEEERVKSDLILQHYEQKGLDGADRAVKTRDSIIDDLSGRLERALDMLALEREQQRQRRQIIFPTQRPQPLSNGKTSDDSDVELKVTRDALRDCKGAMESLRRDNERKELEGKLKIESLERQLEVARAV